MRSLRIVLAAALLLLAPAVPAAFGGKPAAPPPPSPPSDPAIAYVDPTGNLVEVNADGTGTYVVVPAVKVQARRGWAWYGSADPEWSPTGRQIVYASYVPGSYGIWVVNTDGSGRRVVVPGGDFISVNAAAWSPGPVPGAGGGRFRIAYQRNATASEWTDLWLVDPDGSDPVAVTATPDVGEVTPTWDPSGTRLACCLQNRIAPGVDEDRLVILDFAAGTTTTVLVGGPLAGGQVRSCSWSKVNESLIYVHGRPAGGNSLDDDLFVVDLADPSRPSRLTSTTAQSERFPSGSPDGTRLVFEVQDAGGNRWIDTVDTDGTGRATLASPTGGGGYRGPAWRRNP